MPEGDTIWRTAAGLRAAVAGREVVAARPAALARLAGRTLDAVEPAGKHLLMRFSGGWTLHSHMRMGGSWHLYRRGERWRRPAHLAKAVIDFGECDAVCFGAPVVELVRDERPAVGHLGPDILADDFRPEQAVARARGLGPVAIGELLLDQRVCAGIGNVYRCETLWQHGVDPWRSSGDLSDETLRDLFATARADMLANVRGAWAGRRFAGGRPAAVHGRGGRPCPRCGTTIRIRRQGDLGRLCYWCPACQGMSAN